MTHSEGVGGSAAHDRRREGTVSPRDQNPQSAAGGGGTAEEQLADPNRPHRSPSAREERRAEERRAQRSADAEADEEPGDDAGA
jgi:hypothetical protein